MHVPRAAVVSLLVFAAAPATAGEDQAPTEAASDASLAEATPAAPGADETLVAPTPDASAAEAVPLAINYRTCGSGFGVRAGRADFTSDKREVDDAPLFGLFLDRRKGNRLACEMGLDFARPEAEDGSFESSLLFGRFDVLLSAGGAGPIAGGYFLCGAGGAAESTSDLTGDHRNFVGVVNLGAGFGVADGRFDLRFTHTMPLGSHNVSAITLISAGVRF